MKDNEIILIIVVILAVFLLGGFGMMGLGGGYGGMWGMMGSYYPGFGGMWIFGWLIMILVVVALVLFIAWLVKQLQNSGGRR